MVTQKDELLMESLRSVIDPEIGLNIVELGLIRQIEINEEEMGTKLQVRKVYK